MISIEKIDNTIMLSSNTQEDMDAKIEEFKKQGYIVDQAYYEDWVGVYIASMILKDK